MTHQGLLGLDFLGHFRFIYDGPTQAFELASDALPPVARSQP